jgi:flagellar hook-basal body complex protein FliE
MPTPLGAANAYASLARITDPGAGLGKAAGGGASGAGPDFGSVLKEALGSVVETGRKSDAQTQALAAGKSNMVDVVTAVAETEVAVGALVSVRDKVIQAYEEIMRMPI